MNELEKRAQELDKMERELNAYAREVLERERAVQVAEENAAKAGEINRTDYLFDKINRDNRKISDPTPAIIQIPYPSTNVTNSLTAAMATIAAVTSVITLLVSVLGS